MQIRSPLPGSGRRPVTPRIFFHCFSPRYTAMRFVCIIGLALVAAVSIPLVSAEEVTGTPATISVSESTPISSLPLDLTALGFAFAGAVTRKTKKVTLAGAYMHEGITYGPGADIDVPETFPDIDGDTGDVIHPEGSRAAANAARNRSFSSPPSTGGVNTGEGGGGGNTVSGKTEEELDSMTRADLVDMAESLNIAVEREDGGDGDPLKSDYVAALSKAR